MARMNGEAQSSNAVLMVRPAAFGFHAEAAQSNAFASDRGAEETAVLREFDGAVEALAKQGVDVLILEDQPHPPKPDAIFPNNWVSFHADGSMILYPMATAARRLERKVGCMTALLDAHGFEVRRTIDLSEQERSGRFLEGTGSLILDRPRKRAFAARSPRTDPQVIALFDELTGFSTLMFNAFDRKHRPIYHTNVLLSLGTEFAILCEAVLPEADRRAVIAELEASGRSIITVEYEQMACFACNALELKGLDGPVIALSAAARGSLRPDQLQSLERFGTLAGAPIPTIEVVGGGSLRCMIADIHLPRRTNLP
jgi:hypothetical protein